MVKTYSGYAVHQRSPATPSKDISSYYSNSKCATYQSDTCHESKIDAARTASELSLEKLPIAPWSPLSATPRWK